MLYPIQTKTRKLMSLDGIWRFKTDKITLDESQVGKKLQNYINMPVPSSYNDITSSNEIRNHQGWVWYEREINLDNDLLDERLLIRFGSVTHKARLYVNGEFMCEHIGGFTPFEVELNEVVSSEKNLIQVAVENILDFTTIPVGMVSGEGEDKKSQGLFDFFNYAGIHRPVKLYTTPKSYLKDITVVTDYTGSEGVINYSIEVEGNVSASIKVFDEEDNLVAVSMGNEGKVKIDDVNLWMPMNAYLYNLVVELNNGEILVDEYELPVGIRTVEVRGKQFLINGEPFYFKGFGKHEDSHIHGRGFDEALNVKDLNLMKWMGANSFRTSHYPYSEEMMRLAMREGIVIIDEVPAVGMMLGMAAFGALFGGSQVKLDTWKDLKTKENHERVLRELIARDKNNPAVVLWSVANEPDSQLNGAYEYFEPLCKLTKELDPQKRPITIVTHLMAPAGKDLIYPLVDVISLNRYFGWYRESGDLKAAAVALKEELNKWAEIDGDKPIVFTEYGADTVAGFHDVYDIMFTEEYQVKFYEMYHEVFDEFAQVVGEQAWNFADFEVWQGIMRIQGNKKGMFTRERQPKAVVQSVKKRWTSIPELGYKK